MTNQDLDFFIMMFKLYFMYIPLVGGIFALYLLVSNIKKELKNIKKENEVQLEWNKDQHKINESSRRWMEVQMRINTDD